MMSTPQRLDGWVSHWSAQSPQAPALMLGDDVVSYAAFEEKIKILAAKLRDQGIAVGDRIGICAQKSIVGLVGIYAILRVGAAYVPLDPMAPAARLAKITSDCGLHAILTDKRGLSDICEIAKVDEIGVFDLSLGAWHRHVSSNSKLPHPSPPDLAYVLYTSGSTGTPKGIAHSHASGLGYAQMAANLCELSSDDRVSHHTPSHFDMSIFDIFSTSIAGACLVIIPEIYTKVPASLASLVSKAQISVWYSVPFALIQLADHGALENHDLSHLRTVMFAGEAMHPDQLRRFAKYAPQAEFINAYGPTETNHCTSHRFTAKALDQMGTIPIGSPEKGVTVHLEGQNPETGEAELWIAAPQVMLGYWQDIQLGTTSLRAVPDSDHLSFATGDIVREVDGIFHLVGRKDRQIKIRGYRIELDEVEKVIASCDGVGEVAVVHCREAQEIRAFVTATDHFEVTPQIVVTHCKAALPAYAVPADVAVLPHLIRTSTGKIDRRAISEMAHD